MTMRDASFLRALQVLDVEIATRTRARDCPHCGGPLHTADYPRKPRAGPWTIPDDMAVRRGLCCGRQGCRRRARVPSALFFGRRVYVGVIVVLGAVLQHGVSAKRVGVLSLELGVDRRTLTRWRRWWLDTFPATHAYTELRAAIVPPPDPATTPHSLIASYQGTGPPEQATALLRHLTMLEEASLFEG